MERLKTILEGLVVNRHIREKERNQIKEALALIYDGDIRQCLCDRDVSFDLDELEDEA